MCTEALIANIKKAEKEKQLTYMKVAKACPSMSHLLFADDSLFFFCKTQKEECETILQILEEYEVVSCQQINFQKSSLQFRHKIDSGYSWISQPKFDGIILGDPIESERIKNSSLWFHSGSLK